MPPRAHEERIERQLWSLAGQALEGRRRASAPRLYVETLNEMIDGETARVAALSNRVPTAVLVLEVLGAALALGLLAAYLAIVGRGVLAVSLASVLVAFLLLVTADLDRPTRGMIQVPDAVLKEQLTAMTESPAAGTPLPVALTRRAPSRALARPPAPPARMTTGGPASPRHANAQLARMRAFSAANSSSFNIPCAFRSARSFSFSTRLCSGAAGAAAGASGAYCCCW